MTYSDATAKMLSDLLEKGELRIGRKLDEKSSRYKTSVVLARRGKHDLQYWVGTPFTEARYSPVDFLTADLSRIIKGLHRSLCGPTAEGEE